jgi:hypothetical protein
LFCKQTKTSSSSSITTSISYFTLSPKTADHIMSSETPEPTESELIDQEIAALKEQGQPSKPMAHSKHHLTHRTNSCCIAQVAQDRSIHYPLCALDASPPKVK